MVQMDPIAESKKARRKGDSSLALGALLAIAGLAMAGWGLSAPFYENRTPGTVIGFVLFGLGAFELWYGWHYRQRAEKLENVALGNANPAAWPTAHSQASWPAAPMPTASVGSAFCSACGKGLVVGAAFCSHCGAAVPR